MWAMFLSRRRRLGLHSAIGQFLFQFCVVPVVYHKSRKRIEQIMREHRLKDTDLQPLGPEKVANVNDALVQRRLVEFAPDIVLVYGTRIIKPPVLGCVEAKFVNIHIGITPMYRGLHGGYWALWNGDPDNFGATVHLVDPGVDTGQPLKQIWTQPSKKDSFATYPLLQLAKALNAVHEIISDLPNSLIADGGTFVDRPSHQWSVPTLWQYLKGQLRGIR